MKIRIITNAKMAYYINVENTNFDDVVKKILEQKYIKLNENTIILTSAIAEIARIK